MLPNSGLAIKINQVKREVFSKSTSIVLDTLNNDFTWLRV